MPTFCDDANNDNDDNNDRLHEAKPQFPAELIFAGNKILIYGLMTSFMAFGKKQGGDIRVQKPNLTDRD